MSLRTFVFCDICNPQGVRQWEERRGTERTNKSREGRRIVDGRMWFEGSVAEALTNDWHVDDTGKHICPLCYR